MVLSQFTKYRPSPFKCDKIRFLARKFTQCFETYKNTIFATISIFFAILSIWDMIDFENFIFHSFQHCAYLSCKYGHFWERLGSLVGNIFSGENFPKFYREKNENLVHSHLYLNKTLDRNIRSISLKTIQVTLWKCEQLLFDLRQRSCKYVQNIVWLILLQLKKGRYSQLQIAIIIHGRYALSIAWIYFSVLFLKL